MEEFIAKYGQYFIYAVLLWEFILGKTKLVKANSTIEAIGNGIASVFKIIFGKKELPK